MHISVLLHEVLEGLSIREGDIIVDATVGGAGYTKAFCERVGASGKVYGFDEDRAALERANKICFGYQFVPCEGNFRAMKEVLATKGVTSIDGCAFDLGLSSFQLEESGRGFSFLRDEPLSMTFREGRDESRLTAEDIVNRFAEEDLANVIFGYGEERYARRIAQAIVDARSKEPLTTTAQLVLAIKAGTPTGYHHGPIHPATRTFQAIRIAVNDELGALREGLVAAYDLTASGRRIAVVSFHSLEDRIVKNFFREKAAEGATLITKKPIIPGESEMRANPRSRSAKLRILQKQGTGNM